jgi:DNA mismatch endonuclease (patch repair protein)
MPRDPVVTSRIMASVRGKDTRPEIALRRGLWALGYRYRVHPAGLTGRPDLVFPSARVAVFVDGDFWHGNPSEWRRRGKATIAEMFPSRTQWWVEKIERNIVRDRDVSLSLRSDGWAVVRVWESAIAVNRGAVIRRIAGVLNGNNILD